MTTSLEANFYMLHTLSPENCALNSANWLAAIEQHYGNNIPLVRQAYSLAQLAGEEQATPYGTSCLQQGLLMTSILAELQLDQETLASALVYNSVRYAGLTLDDVAEHLGEKVAKLIKGTQQMDAINVLHDAHQWHHHDANTMDNVRKMLLAMVDNVQVVFLKLAERLSLLRHLAIFNQNKQRRYAQETLEIYAPLANRLGIGQLKWQLEDFAFRYLHPEEYKQISQALNARRVDREKYIQQMLEELKTLLVQAGISTSKITGRAKHIYSIHRKMQRKKVPIEEIYDIHAVRIIVPTIEACYTALSAVHANWKYVPKEFDDYIATPKSNGYQSIHTVVKGPEERMFEIQIRTQAIHDAAELGIAAHWVYKEGGHKLGSYEEKIAWLRQVMDWQKEVATDEAREEVQTQLFDDRVYVFTPTGDVLDLPKGATPLDFAYHVHSAVGNRCRGAKVNGHIVPLTHELQTGERVEVLTTKNGQPSRDWLNPHLGYLKTPRAKAKVLQWFKKQDFDKNLAYGRDLFEREQKRLNLKNINLEELAKKFNYKISDDLLAALGRGELRINNLLQAIHLPLEPQQMIATPLNQLLSKFVTQETAGDIDIHGVGNLLTFMAKCCKPIPGDTIVGYVTRGRGVAIHRENCTNILRAQALASDRLIQVNWGAHTQKTYAVDLVIVAYNRYDLPRELSSLLTNEHTPILAINTTNNPTENTMEIHLTIEIDSLIPLSKILARISQLPNVYEVRRLR
jgi:GTP pyrophosphokinase